MADLTGLHTSLPKRFASTTSIFTRPVKGVRQQPGGVGTDPCAALKGRGLRFWSGAGVVTVQKPGRGRGRQLHKRDTASRARSPPAAALRTRRPQAHALQREAASSPCAAPGCLSPGQRATKRMVIWNGIKIGFLSISFTVPIRHTVLLFFIYSLFPNFTKKQSWASAGYFSESVRFKTAVSFVFPTTIKLLHFSEKMVRHWKLPLDTE